MFFFCPYWKPSYFQGRLIESEFNWVRQALFLSSQTDPAKAQAITVVQRMQNFVGAVTNVRARAPDVHIRAFVEQKFLINRLWPKFLIVLTAPRPAEVNKRSFDAFE